MTDWTPVVPVGAPIASVADQTAEPTELAEDGGDEMPDLNPHTANALDSADDAEAAGENERVPDAIGRFTVRLDLMTDEWGLGRTAPPGPAVTRFVSPLSSSYRSIAKTSRLVSCAYWKVPPGVMFRVK